MGEYERMVVEFTAIVLAPHLGALLLTVALIALVAVAIRALRVPERAITLPLVALGVASLATTASGRGHRQRARARAPSGLEHIRV